MSNAIAQSATQLTVSTNGEDNFPFVEIVKDCAHQNASGITRERQSLNRNKLISKVCARYRSEFAEIYGKSERLPTDVFQKIEKHVDDYIVSQLSAINPANIISQRKSFFVNRRDMCVTERITSIGENMLALKEQHLGINLAIGQLERRKKKLEQMPDSASNWKQEQLDNLSERMKQLEIVKLFIEREIKNQNKVAAS